MVFFVESDFGYSPVVNMKQPATGVRRKVLKQFAPPPDDTPELQEARPVVKLFYLGTLDAHQKLEKVVKARRGKWFHRLEYDLSSPLTFQSQGWASLSRHLEKSSHRCTCKKRILVSLRLTAN
jgi:hypothetical protein